MKTVTPKEMALLDRMTIEKGISSVDLMERAGRACVDAIVNHVKTKKLKHSLKYAHITVVCGPGNNGGDGLVIARRMSKLANGVTIFLTEPLEKLSPESRINLERLPLDEVKIDVLSSFESLVHLKSVAEKTDIIVDCVFGTGLDSRPLQEKYRNVIDIINNARKAEVIAIDIPSGLRGENGKTVGAAVRADMTIIIQSLKVGQLLGNGPDLMGKIMMVDIGIDENALPNKKEIVDPGMIHYPVPRKSNTNKYDYGHVRLVVGSIGMVGAGIMAAKAALRSGVGLVTAYVPRDIYTIFAEKAPDEVMVYGFDHKLDPATLTGKKGAVLIGPGLGRHKDYADMIKKILNTDDNPLVIDADGLFHLRKGLDDLKRVTKPVVLTPHMGEFARLIGKNVDDIEEDPLGIGTHFAREYGVVLILKGYHTLIFSPDGQVFFNTTGNPGMATAGSGDVLSGILAAFACQLTNMTEAAITAVYYHGAAGDYYAKNYGMTTLTASDIIDSLKYTLDKN